MCIERCVTIILSEEFHCPDTGSSFLSESCDAHQGEQTRSESSHHQAAESASQAASDSAAASE